MKRVFTILTILLILTSGIQVSIDRHYCGGNLADVKISLSGKPGTCGMETREHNCPKQLSFDKKCCEDQINFYSVTSNYFPEYFKISHPTAGKDLQVTFMLSNVLRSSDVKDLISLALPPGDNLKSAFSLSEICSFRI